MYSRWCALNRSLVATRALARSHQVTQQYCWEWQRFAAAHPLHPLPSALPLVYKSFSVQICREILQRDPNLCCCTEVFARTSFNFYSPQLSISDVVKEIAFSYLKFTLRRQILFSVHPLPITYLIHIQCLVQASANRQGRVERMFQHSCLFLCRCVARWSAPKHA